MEYFTEKPLGAAPAGGKAKGKGKGPPVPKGGAGMPEEVRAKLREEAAPKAAPRLPACPRSSMPLGVREKGVVERRRRSGSSIRAS